MSAETASSMEPREVHVPLLGEGTEVPRPTRAVPCGGRRFRLLTPEDYDPEDEHWAFPPGSIVECVPRVVAGREVLAAVSRES